MARTEVTNKMVSGILDISQPIWKTFAEFNIFRIWQLCFIAAGSIFFSGSSLLASAESSILARMSASMLMSFATYPLYFAFILSLSIISAKRIEKDAGKPIFQIIFLILLMACIGFTIDFIITSWNQYHRFSDAFFPNHSDSDNAALSKCN